MTTMMLELTCRDPIVSRDGRPFGVGQGNRMRSLGWLLPSVVSGSLRTAVGKTANQDFSNKIAKELLQLSVAGFLPVANGRLYLPAPSDCVIHPDQGPLRIVPHLEAEGGCDWPGVGLRPVMLPASDQDEEFKPKPGPDWWPLDSYSQWIVGNSVEFNKDFLESPVCENRTHVQLNAETGTADEGKLFTTVSLPMTHLARYGSSSDYSFRDRFAEISLSLRLEADSWARDALTSLNTLHTLGGERRLIHCKFVETADLWNCPESVSAMLIHTNTIRMTLVTPAIFHGGWKPGWLNSELIGSPCGTGIVLKLVGVSIARWKAVSGWSLADPRGPKPVKRMVPAGGVYFFQVISGDPSELSSCWLQSVSDNEQDQRDGFGLATWGRW